MASQGFFKLPKNKSFNFTPRFYDEKKEMMEERQKQILEGRVPRVAYPNLGNKRNQGMFRQHSNKKIQRQSTIKIVTILLLLIVSVYIILVN